MNLEAERSPEKNSKPVKRRNKTAPKPTPFQNSKFPIGYSSMYFMSSFAYRSLPSEVRWQWSKKREGGYRKDQS
jgi:hypothetical protein